MTFYEWLKQRRKARDYTQKELAGLAGCSPETLRKIEAGVLRPSRRLADLLSAHLELAPEQQILFAQAAREPHRQIPAELYALLSQAGGVRAKPPAQVERARITNLPTAPTPLIGREVDLAAICEPAARRGTPAHAHRPAGVGKTRLSLEAGALLAGSFDDGVVFVPLSAITNPALVPSAIAQEVGVRDTGGKPVVDLRVQGRFPCRGDRGVPYLFIPFSKRLV